jgi:hypothetical protein
VKTFDLTVEGNFDPRNPLTVNPPKLELKKLVWEGDSPPDVIVISDDVMIVKMARYLTPGNHYRYKAASIAKLTNGQLEPVVLEA